MWDNPDRVSEKKKSKRNCLVRGNAQEHQKQKKKRQTENTESIVFNGNIAFDWSNASRPQSRKRNKLSNVRHLKFDEISPTPTCK
jgi:hypothetical protein